MCSRPSRSLKSTVTALMRFSSVKYLMRSSCTLCAATRSRRCFLAFRLSSSSSSYGSAKKLRSSFNMTLLNESFHDFGGRKLERKMPGHEAARVSRGVSRRQIEKPTSSSRKTNATNRFSKTVAALPVTEHESRVASNDSSVVILLPQVRDQVLPHHPAQGVLQLHQLNEQIMLRIQVRRGHRRLEIEA